MEYTGDRNSKGEPNGQGTMTFANGTTYTGEFKDGKRNGQGTGTLPDGDIYTGERNSKGKHHGHSTFAYADGSTYTGEWKDNKPVPLSWRLWCCRMLDSLRILKTPP